VAQKGVYRNSPKHFSLNIRTTTVVNSLLVLVYSSTFEHSFRVHFRRELRLARRETRSTKIMRAQQEW
jgi:hypothetical protein